VLRPAFANPAVWLTRSQVDIRDSAALSAALAGADAVLCMAGVTNGRPGSLATDATLAQHTLDAAQRAGAGRVVLFSSAAVYGRQSGLLHEDGVTSPLSSYGTAKLAMERAATAHTHPSTVLRLGNVAGADAILGGWRPGFRLDQLDDGTTPRRSYIGPHALARVLCRLAPARDVPAIVNVAAPGCVQMGALLDAAGLAWTPRPARPDTIPSVNLDTRRLGLFTEFKASGSTTKGIVADWQHGLT